MVIMGGDDKIPLDLLGCLRQNFTLLGVKLHLYKHRQDV
jgi:hypothetical protein